MCCHRVSVQLSSEWQTNPVYYQKNNTYKLWISWVKFRQRAKERQELSPLTSTRHLNDKAHTSPRHKREGTTMQSSTLIINQYRSTINQFRSAGWISKLIPEAALYSGAETITHKLLQGDRINVFATFHNQFRTGRWSFGLHGLWCQAEVWKN